MKITLQRTWCDKNNETVFYLPKILFFANINVIPFKEVPWSSFKPMEMFLPLLVAALEVSNRPLHFFGRFLKYRKDVL